MTRTARLPTAIVLACAAGLLFMCGAPAPAAPADTASRPAASKPAELPPDVSVTERGTVELHVQQADLRRVLQLLSTQSRTNIIASKEVVGTVTADLYGVTFHEALDAVLKSAGFVYLQKGNFIYVYTAKQMDDIQAAERQMMVKLFRLNYITAADAKAVIAPALSERGTISTTPPVAEGITSSKDKTGGASLAGEDVLVVRDYPENLEKVTAIMRELDVRPMQVLIEATLLRATLDERNALGVEFNALAGVDFRSLASASTGLTSVVPGVVPGKVMDQGAATFRTDVNAGMDPGGLTIGFISNEIAFFIRALETVTDVTILANPKLLIMNKMRGEIMVGRRDGYITTTITETSSTQTVQFLETGTKLIVRPYVASDGYIRMEIHPEDSAGGITADKLPWEQTTEITSNILVRDGHTIVVGGLFRERTTNARSQVPFLGNIPYAGNLFRRRNDETNREEVIVLITPHIIKVPVDEIASLQAREDVDRVRFGARQGLMWFGRDRMAQSHMRAAKDNLARGKRKQAMWDVNMALSLQPRMEEALRLKERLTEQALWAGEARESSAGIVIQRMMMQELGLPVDLVLSPARPRNGMDLPEDVREAFGVGPRYELPLPGAGRTTSQSASRPAAARPPTGQPPEPLPGMSEPAPRPAPIKNERALPPIRPAAMDIPPRPASQPVK